MFSRLALVLTLFSCTVLMAQAPPTDAKTAKIEEFFKVTHVDQMSGQLIKIVADQMKSGMTQQLTGVQMTPEQQKRFDAFNDKVWKVITDAMGWDKLKPDYVKIYSDAFTEQQIDDILAFYKSPAGRAIVEKTPGLMQQGADLGRERLAAITPQLQQLMKDFVAQEAAAREQEKK